jgi:ATP-dependent Zn protease
MNANLRNFAVWVVIVLLLLALFSLFQSPCQRTPANDISFSQLLREVDAGRVRDVLIQGSDITGQFTDGRQVQTCAPTALLDELRADASTGAGGDDRAALVQRGLKALADLLAGVGISFSSPGIGHEWD